MKKTCRNKAIAVLLSLLLLAAAFPYSTLAGSLPLTQLNCLDNMFLYKAYFTDDGKLFAYNQIDDAQTGNYVDNYYLIDLNSDTITAQRSITDFDGLEYIGTRTNGELVCTTMEEFDTYVVVLDASLQIKNIFPVDGYNPYFDAAQDCLFSYNDKTSVFSRVDFNGASTPVLRNVSVEAYDPARQWIVTEDAHDELGAGYQFGVYSLAEDAYLFGVVERYNSYCFANDRLICDEYLFQDNGDSDEPVLDAISITVYGFDGTPEHRWLFEECPYRFTGAPVMVVDRVVHPDGDKSSGEIIGLDIVELHSGQTVFLPGMDIVSNNYDSSQQRLLIHHNVQGAYYLLDCAKLSYTDVLDPQPLPDTEPPAPAVLGDYLADVRAEADEIETEFGIEILLGDEILNVVDSWASTQEREDHDEEIGAIRTELAMIRETFSGHLPEGFLNCFRDPYGRRGLRILLCDGKRGEDDIGGEEFCTSKWYTILLHTGYPKAEHLMHELWHALEDLITMDHPEAINEDEWQTLNPDGFEYDDFARSGWLDEGQHEMLLTRGNITDGWFAREYSIANAKEDRATILEALYADLSSGYVFCADQYTGTMYDLLTVSPHLRAKLDYLAQAVRGYFGYVFWEDEFAIPACTGNSGAHNWGEPVYEWDGYIQFVTAVRKCEDCGIKQQTGSIASYTHEGDCLHGYTFTYTAPFAAPFETQVKTVTTPARQKHGDLCFFEGRPYSLWCDSWLSHYYCYECQQYFSDEAGTVPLQKEDVIFPPIQFGDVDLNGKIEPADARLALRIAVKLEPSITPDSVAYEAANVTEMDKGTVDSADARLILRKSVGIEDDEFAT